MGVLRPFVATESYKIKVYSETSKKRQLCIIELNNLTVEKSAFLESNSFYPVLAQLRQDS